MLGDAGDKVNFPTYPSGCGKSQPSALQLSHALVTLFSSLVGLVSSKHRDKRRSETEKGLTCWSSLVFPSTLQTSPPASVLDSVRRVRRLRLSDTLK
ncbi:unnamed protein product [Protopolystoma xenopodis]|uniref:Uncharacterized protein n=1 Tax=Protopolystoma xenopodis TaxID=117903 RepID=A0A3S5B9C2_9PLAT|nr:unnamed protein product [Protopolystoma xenopodis]